MKKQLPTDIANELAGSSVFFRNRQPDASPQPSSPAESRQPEASDNHVTVPPRRHVTTGAGRHGVQPPSDRDVYQPNNRAPMPLSEVGHTVPEKLEEVRRVVKQPGKEAATYRLTGLEKRALADLVYTYQRQGYRTSENEVARIAINWLLLDHRQQGARSVLAQMLEALHG